ncbi:MAG: hypothetical protein KAU46_01915 [Candidatus Aminicenantes bacterium]|nr:hypothetical protein [Candidatus Aminicenantes bacterium]
MSMTWGDVDFEMYMSDVAQEEFEAEIAAKVIADLPLDKIRDYLGTYGDAIESRVNKCVLEAKKLEEIKYYGLSLVRAVTAMEVIIRYFVLRPLLEGAFLADKLAGIIIQRILPNRSYSDRGLLIDLTKHLKIPLTDLKLSDDSKLWATFNEKIVFKRNRVVHRADDIEKKYALLAIECVDIFMLHVIAPIAKKFGMGWPDTRVWHEFNYTNETGVTTHFNYKPSNPFE